MTKILNELESPYFIPPPEIQAPFFEVPFLSDLLHIESTQLYRPRVSSMDSKVRKALFRLQRVVQRLIGVDPTGISHGSAGYLRSNVITLQAGAGRKEFLLRPPMNGKLIGISYETHAGDAEVLLDNLCVGGGANLLSMYDGICLENFHRGEPISVLTSRLRETVFVRHPNYVSATLRVLGPANAYRAFSLYAIFEPVSSDEPKAEPSSDHEAEPVKRLGRPPKKVVQTLTEVG